MKNVSSLKSNNINSPKTPGGISKSLLTPCRRLGLSRNWRKSGPSPFISPLAGNSTVVTEEKKETRKRKERVIDENTEDTGKVTSDNENEEISQNIDKTPSRNVELPRKKKSKTLISTINESQDDIDAQKQAVSDNNNEVNSAEEPHTCNSQNNEVSTPVRSKSKNSKKRNVAIKSSPKEVKIESVTNIDDSSKNEVITKNNPTNMNTPAIEQRSNEEAIYTIKEKSPNDLSKECVVVIQRKIFKNIENKADTQKTKHTEEKSANDSDSDEAPLVNLKKHNSVKSIGSIENDDDDFTDSKTIIPKPNKVLETKSPKNKLKTKKILKVKPEKVNEPKPPSQNCFDDDDDDFENKKTILIRKTYEKISKPIKAKSTGSITQRDIDNLRDRIEAKKKLLLAQSLTPETEELRTLIKKWQKGCQDALMELLDLMRNKCPDKERMDHADMLKALKIPPSLVGYDSENDCFNSPDDASIILGQFKDI